MNLCCVYNMDSNIKIVLYDGNCNLCNYSLQFLLRHDSKKVFQYMPLQSKEAKAILSINYHETNIPDSIILVEDSNTSEKSEAFFRIIPHLGIQFRVFYIFKLIPKKQRDQLYDWVARKRYGWFGEYTDCKIDHTFEK